MQHLEDPECDEGRVVPSGDDRREERREGGESEAGAVHRLESKALRQTPAEDL